MLRLQGAVKTHGFSGSVIGNLIIDNYQSVGIWFDDLWYGVHLATLLPCNLDTCYLLPCYGWYLATCGTTRTAPHPTPPYRPFFVVQRGEGQFDGVCLTAARGVLRENNTTLE